MKSRLFAAFLCVCLLVSMSTVTVGAAAVIAPEGTTPGVTATYKDLSFAASYGTTDGKALSALTTYDEATVNALNTGIEEGITLESSTGIPCQIFTIDVSTCSADSVLLTLSASTIANERLALKVFNPSTSKWDTVATAISNANAIGGEVDVATYAANGIIKAMATPDYVANGSNRIIWSTDQQHYTKFKDLNQTYYDINTYIVGEYQADRAAYMINTGDIVDDLPSSSLSTAQWVVADKAFDILDEANVPYGIETGNHDVGDFPANDYSKYTKYFPASRYEDRPWYGGEIDDNACHYDLITVGNVDLLMLYLGYGVEANNVDWANEVIAKYPHRSVIICTHQYLKPTTVELSGRGDIINDNIVLPNPNVMMILSGHYEGAAYRTQEIDGRIIQEVMADYQFVQKESEEYYKDAPDPTHSIGSVANCNGEGYMREILIEGNTVSMYAFSPVTGGEMPYGARDNITLEVPFATAQRKITTYRFGAHEAASDGNTSVTTLTAEDDTVLYEVSSDGAAAADGVLTHAYADRDNLQSLIDEAKTVKKSLYTKESYTAFKEALNAAKTALKGDDDQAVTEAATALANTKGALCEIDDGMKREKLTTVIDLDMNLANWENADGTASLFTDYSFIDSEQLEGGGFTAKAGEQSPNSWPAIKYSEPITFTPEDGKVYLYLDMEANSTWSFYPTVIQDGTQYMGRWNYIIEGSYNNTFDAGSGNYKGVYDITDALVDLGVDPTKEMTLSVVINVVPGPVTFREISVLTGEYPTGLFGGNMGMILGIAGGAVVIIGLFLFAVLYKPKKKENVAAEEVTAEVSDENTESTNTDSQ